MQTKNDSELKELSEMDQAIMDIVKRACASVRQKDELLKKLQHEYDTTRGLWCIDRDPKEVDLEWIRENAFQLTTLPTESEQTLANQLPHEEQQETRAERIERLFCSIRYGSRTPVGSWLSPKAEHEPITPEKQS